METNPLEVRGVKDEKNITDRQELGEKKGRKREDVAFNECFSPFKTPLWQNTFKVILGQEKKA